ncbi:MAG: 50S ribosomal protein L32 [Planctomycetes bacterium GWF2_41_51]|nr:MAG: 50S ribosomal protein L32 [Planctomycetes bacterium GWF2_41_51]
MLPAKKTSKTRTKSRRSHQALKALNLSVCKKCASPKLSHAACATCGYVNSKITLKIAKSEENA